MATGSFDPTKKYHKLGKTNYPPFLTACGQEVVNGVGLTDGVGVEIVDGKIHGKDSKGASRQIGLICADCAKA